MKGKLDRQALMKLKQEGRLDKNDLLFFKILNDEPLSKTEEERYQKYLQAQNLLNSFYTPTMVARHLEKQYAITHRQARRIVSEAVSLMGSQSELSREGIASIVTDVYLIVIQEAKKLQDYKLMKEGADSLAKLHRLYAENKEPLNLEMPTFVISPDPTALRQHTNLDRIEETDSEAIE